MADDTIIRPACWPARTQNDVAQENDSVHTLPIPVSEDTNMSTLTREEHDSKLASAQAETRALMLEWRRESDKEFAIWREQISQQQAQHRLEAEQYKREADARFGATVAQISERFTRMEAGFATSEARLETKISDASNKAIGIIVGAIFAMLSIAVGIILWHTPSQLPNTHSPVQQYEAHAPYKSLPPTLKP